MIIEKIRNAVAILRGKIKQIRYGREYVIHISNVHVESDYILLTLKLVWHDCDVSTCLQQILITQWSWRVIRLRWLDYSIDMIDWRNLSEHME